MFNYTKQDIILLAEENGFKKETLEKELRLISILDFFSNDDLLKEALSLKGGTAINLIYFNLPRLSVDIDVDYIKSIEKEQMIEDRKVIKKKILQYMLDNNYQYKEEKSKETHALDSFVFMFESTFNYRDVIKIEINYMDRIHLYKEDKKRINNFLNKEVDVLTLNKFDLFASKFSALFNRTTIRDIYDAGNVIKSNLFDDDEIKILNQCILFYLMIGAEGKLNVDNTIINCFKKMDVFLGKRIPQYLTSTLNVKDSFNIVEEIRNIKIFIEQFAKYINEEFKDLVEQFNNGNINLKLLEDEKKNDIILKHPMMKWKIKI